MPKKDRVELERHLANVKAVYARVHILTGSMILHYRGLSYLADLLLRRRALRL